MGWIEIEDAKPRVECCVRSPGCCFQSGELQCRAGPIRAGSRQSSRHRRDRLVSEPEMGRAQGEGAFRLRGPVQQRPHHDRGRIADRRDVHQRLRLQPDASSFRVFAVSAGGTWSNASNTVTATLSPDTTPAAKPVVSSTGSGPTHVDLSWSYADNDPSPRFDIYVNGQLWYGQVAGLSKRSVSSPRARTTPSGCGRATRRATGRS